MHARAAVLLHLSAAVPRSIEEAALAALALRNTKPDPTALLRRQLKVGAWANGPSEAPPNTLHTAFALLELRMATVRAAKIAAERGLHFRLHSRICG